MSDGKRPLESTAPTDQAVRPRPVRCGAALGAAG